jgi:hypothetical protein
MRLLAPLSPAAGSDTNATPAERSPARKKGERMGPVLKVVAVVFWLIALFLVYAVIHAVASAGGARVGVAIGYMAGAVILSTLGIWLWRRRTRAATGGAAGQP